MLAKDFNAAIILMEPGVHSNWSTPRTIWDLRLIFKEASWVTKSSSYYSSLNINTSPLTYSPFQLKWICTQQNWNFKLACTVIGSIRNTENSHFIQHSCRLVPPEHTQNMDLANNPLCSTFYLKLTFIPVLIAWIYKVWAQAKQDMSFRSLTLPKLLLRI